MNQDILLLNDQPVTCPTCGSRTNFSTRPDGVQEHTCLANNQHVFLAQEDEANPETVTDKHYIVPVYGYDGDSTSMELYNEGQVVEKLFCIVGITDAGGSIIDSGYRSHEEAKEAWPEAI